VRSAAQATQIVRVSLRQLGQKLEDIASLSPPSSLQRRICWRQQKAARLNAQFGQKERLPLRRERHIVEPYDKSSHKAPPPPPPLPTPPTPPPPPSSKSQPASQLQSEVLMSERNENSKRPRPAENTSTYIEDSRQGNPNPPCNSPQNAPSKPTIGPHAMSGQHSAYPKVQQETKRKKKSSNVLDNDEGRKEAVNWFSSVFIEATQGQTDSHEELQMDLG